MTALTETLTALALDPKLEKALLQARKGATAGFNPKRWSEVLTHLGYTVSFSDTGRNRMIHITAADGESCKVPARSGYEIRLFLRSRNIEAAAASALGLPTIEAEKAEKDAKTRDWTNTGTCGCCDMNVKMTKDGFVWDHGYTLPSWGERQDSCFGAQTYLPYEVSTKSCEAYRDVAQQGLERARARSVELAAENYSEPLSNQKRGKYFAMIVPAGNVGEEPSTDEKELRLAGYRYADALKAARNKTARTIRICEGEVKRMADKIEAWEPGMKMPEEIARERGWIK